MSADKEIAETNADLAALLREVGPRDEPPREVVQAVRAVVHSEWQAVVAARRARQRVRWALAASVLLAVAAGFIGWREWSTVDMQAPLSASFASVTRVDGVVTSTQRSAQALQMGDGIAIGETLHTTSGARAALQLAPGLSLRLDQDTTLAIVAPDRVALIGGALYVDSLPGLPHVDLTIEALGSVVRHLGTQYQVRTLATTVEIGVREGQITVINPAGASTGQAGERIRVAADGAISRSALPAWDPDWQWVADSAPTFAIDNQPLAEFLEWVARETGRQLIYASPAAEQVAARVRMQGSIVGLDIATALTAVLATTELRAESEAQFLKIALK